MGLDYIRAQTGRPWRKQWDGGFDRLKTPTLLDLTMSEASRVVTAKLDPAARVPLKIGWIGSPVKESSVLFSWVDTPFKTFDDVVKSEMVVASTAFQGHFCSGKGAGRGSLYLYGRAFWEREDSSRVCPRGGSGSV